MPYPVGKRKSFKWWRYFTAEALWRNWLTEWREIVGITSAKFTVAITDTFVNIEFDLEITEAVKDTGAYVHGDANVEIVSDNTDEGVAGELLDEDVTFAHGAATIPITLEHTGEQTLTIEIADVTPTEEVVITVQEDTGG